MFNGIKSFFAKIGLDVFLTLLICAVGLAFLKPEIGAGTGPFSLSSIANYLISVIFFFYGLKLSKEKFKVGISNIGLHVVIQAATFIVFPLLILLIRPFFSGEGNIMLWLGIFYLAALPSTVSSSVVMVSIAKGNIPGAIFDASISSLSGVFITPLWMGLVLSGTVGFESGELAGIIFKLSLQILLPLTVGMLLNKKWGKFAEKNNRNLKLFDQGVILLIIYTSFCESFGQKIFEYLPMMKILATAIGMILLFFAVYGIITLVAKLLKFDYEDTVTAQFCGSKKSLVHGTAMSKVIFHGFTGVGIILLPIMIYHALQLMLVTAIARRKIASRKE
jgi:sodium/bile acid cotransporter 7